MRLENKDVDMIKGVITQLLDEFKGELLCNIRERDRKYVVKIFHTNLILIHLMRQ